MLGSHMASISSRTFVRRLYFHVHSASAWQVAFQLDRLALTKLTINSSAYPDGHPGSDLNEDQELAFLKAKIDAGADYIVTQLFYDTDRFREWMHKVRQKGTYILYKYDKLHFTL
jgi:5,10-methylenetetrahydrofolate reductase